MYMSNEHTTVCSLAFGILKYMEKHIRKVVKNGRDSYYINIPKELVREMKIRERQKLTIRRHGKKLIIEDWKR